MSVGSGVDALGEVLEQRLALLQTAVGCRGGRGAEKVAQLEVAVPAPEPLEALLLLVQLGERELLLGDLAFELGLVLAALGDELAPFLLATGGEEGLEALGLGPIAAMCFQEQRVTVTALDQRDRALESLLEGRRRRKRPDALAERERTDAPQLAPDRDAMTGRLGRQPYRQHRPGRTLRSASRHDLDCSSRYARSEEHTSELQ